MGRGQKIFNLFNEEVEQNTSETKQRGRDRDLIAQRNEKLLYRYFFYGYYTDKRNSAVLKQLSLEFDLTEERISRLMSELFDDLQELRQKPPSIKKMAEKYDFFNWSVS